MRFSANLISGAFRREKLDDIEYLIAPVVMARTDVVMNGAVIPVDEIFPETWDGVPVTVGHPEGEAGNFVSANAPDTIATWCVGRIFNTRLDGKKLKAEAWIDVFKCEKLAPGLVSSIEGGTAIDVSTGYFSDDESTSGFLNGVPYEIINTNLRPNHLALLPDAEGACNWDAGCGVRANKEVKMYTIKSALTALENAINQALKMSPETRQRINSVKTKTKNGKPMKSREGELTEEKLATVMALISAEDTPFSDDDKQALTAMSNETLEEMKARYMVPPEEETPAAMEGEPDEETPAAMEGEPDEETPAAMEGEPDEEKPAIAKKNNVVKLKTKKQFNGTCAADREALAYARQIHGEHRAGLVEKIVANSTFTAKQLAVMPVATLETLVQGIRPVPAFYGRAIPVSTEDEKPVPVASLSEAIAARRAGKK